MLRLDKDSGSLLLDTPVKPLGCCNTLLKKKKKTGNALLNIFEPILLFMTQMDWS